MGKCLHLTSVTQAHPMKFVCPAFRALGKAVSKSGNTCTHYDVENDCVEVEGDQQPS